MQTIDVHDLPEQMAKAVAETVENLRAQVKRHLGSTQPVEQVIWPLGVKSELTREDIYDYLDE